MAEHELNKIVDDDGEVFNLRDSTKQPTADRVTSWSSTPSDTKYPSEKLVKTSLDAISTKARTIPQDVSKGANLVVNSSGRMASNYNFTSFLYVPTISYGGSAGSFGYNGTCAENEYISCDFNKKVVFSADVKNLVAQPSNCIHRLYVLEFDIDKKSINAIHVMYGVGTLTELTQDLNPGDTVVHLADLSNANWLSATTYHRGFIFWNYQNSYGYLYPPETYSRNVYPSAVNYPLWEVANVNVSAGTITLNSGWTGPAIPAGTKVSRRSSGNTYPFPASITTGDTEWHSMKGYMRGVYSPGTSERSSTKFSQGTAFIRAGIFPSNLNNTDPVINKRAVVTNFAIYEEQDINDGFGTLHVSRGGTGKTSITSGNYLVGNGTNALTEKTPNVAANDLINALTTEESTPTDNDYYVAQYAGGGTTTKTYHRRPVKALWEYIEAKISSVLGLSESGYSGNASTATTAAGYTSGGAIDTALQGKQDDLGISSSGDSGKFLNEQGSWQVPVYSRSDGHSVWYRNSSWDVGQLLNQYVGKSTTWDNTDDYDLTTLKAGDTIKIYVTVTNMANAHFVMDLKVTEVSSVAPAATVMAIYQADQNEVLDGTDADANNFVIPGNYTLQKVTQVSKNWPGAASGSLDYTNLCVTRLARNNASLPYMDSNDIQQSVRWASRQLYRTKVNGEWGSWRTMPMCSGNYNTATGSETKPVYVDSNGEVKACKEMLLKSGDNATSDCANALLSALPEWTVTPSDDVRLIRRDTGGAASFGQVTFLTVWKYILSKFPSLGWTGSSAKTLSEDVYNYLIGASITFSVNVTSMRESTPYRVYVNWHGNILNIKNTSGSTISMAVGTVGTVSVANNNTYALPDLAPTTWTFIYDGSTLYAVPSSSVKYSLTESSSILAARATGDGSGNTISSTYAKKAVEGVSNGSYGANIGYIAPTALCVIGESHTASSYSVEDIISKTLTASYRNNNGRVYVILNTKSSNVTLTGFVSGTWSLSAGRLTTVVRWNGAYYRQD